MINKVSESDNALPFLERIESDPTILARRISLEGGRWLIWGPSGSGKSNLTSTLATHLNRAGSFCRGIAADPSSPGFGAPGALALGC